LWSCRHSGEEEAAGYSEEEEGSGELHCGGSMKGVKILVGVSVEDSMKRGKKFQWMSVFLKLMVMSSSGSERL